MRSIEKYSGADETEFVRGLLSTPVWFYTWLLEKPEDEVVGYCVSPWKCPLAHFISERTGTSWVVTNKYYQKEGTLSSTALPPWVASFVATVDAPGVGIGGEVPIKAATALAALYGHMFVQGLQEALAFERGEIGARVVRYVEAPDGEMTRVEEQIPATRPIGHAPNEATYRALKALSSSPDAPLTPAGQVDRSAPLTLDNPPPDVLD